MRDSERFWKSLDRTFFLPLFLLFLCYVFSNWRVLMRMIACILLTCNFFHHYSLQFFNPKIYFCNIHAKFLPINKFLPNYFLSKNSSSFLGVNLWKFLEKFLSPSLSISLSLYFIGVQQFLTTLKFKSKPDASRWIPSQKFSPEAAAFNLTHILCALPK